MDLRERLVAARAAGEVWSGWPLALVFALKRCECTASALRKAIYPHVRVEGVWLKCREKRLHDRVATNIMT